MTAIASEEAFLSIIDSHFPRESSSLAMGRGDDCAVIATQEPLCVSSDLFLEDIHFRHSYFSPQDIGYKALAVNISDIAAMGGRPIAFTLDLMIPPQLDQDFWNALLSGMAMLARQNELSLAGGDLSRADKLGIGITIWGTVGPGKRFLQRKQAAKNHVLFACGELGLARVGLQLLEMQGEKAREKYPQAVLAHLRPKPKTMIATLLSAANPATLMDVSDGLAKDLPRLLGKDIGATITIDEEMMHPELLQFAEEYDISAEELFLLGGEDYALLGTADELTFDSKIATIPGIKKLGITTDNNGVTVNGKQATLEGFDHFR